MREACDILKSVPNVATQLSVLYKGYVTTLELRPLHVLDDLGPVGQGASNAHYVQAENGSEYVVKGPHLANGNPFIGANEIIAAEVAKSLGLPTLDWRLLELEGQLCFGCQRVEFAPIFDGTILSNLRNRERIYDMVAFDLWILNIDRGESNIRVRKVQKRPDQYVLLMIDHSHALLSPGKMVDDLPTMINYYGQELVNSRVIRDSLVSEKCLNSSVEMMVRTPDSIIEAAVNLVPNIWLSPEQKTKVADMLKQRRGKLGTFCQKLKLELPKLQQGG